MASLRFLEVVFTIICVAFAARAEDIGSDLVGHWKLSSDCKDHSDHGNDATNHGADLSATNPDGKGIAAFDGRDDFIEVADSPSLRFGSDDFSVAVWVHTEAVLDDVLGDIISKYDPASRTGFNLTIMNFPGVTTAQSNYRQVLFGIDDGKIDAQWTDRGRPGDPQLVMALAVHDGNLYAGTYEFGADRTGHVYRYAGGKRWIDCGSPDRCNAVMSLAVYNGELFAGTGRYSGVRSSSLPESPNQTPGARIFRYEGGTNWVGCGKLGDAADIHGLAVYRGKLYASVMYSQGFYRFDGGTTWTSLGTPPGSRVETLGVFNGILYASTFDPGPAGEAGAFRYDGTSWSESLPAPGVWQSYSFVSHRGALCMGTWPEGTVFRLDGSSNWTSIGRLGDEREVMAMVVYNGKLYAGTLPLGQVYRYDNGSTWTLTGQLDSTPDVRYRRAWSMAVYDGKLFCGTLPSGRVLSLEAGRSVTLDRALQPGWRHLVAVRGGGRLKLYVDGELAATSRPFDSAEYDLSTAAPLRIGFGEHDYFNGQMRDLRIYRQALAPSVVRALYEGG